MNRLSPTPADPMDRNAAWSSARIWHEEGGTLGGMVVINGRERTSDCISSALDDSCGPAEYEWLYTEEEMNRPGCEDWIPLCEACVAYWREHATRPYRVRTRRVPPPAPGPPNPPKPPHHRPVG